MQLQVICDNQQWKFKRPLKELTIKKIIERLPIRINNLPNQFTLQYEDVDGDMIDVTCDADLQTIIECQLDNQLITLYVLQVEQGGFIKEQVCHRKEKRKELIKQLVNQQVMELIPEITKQVKLSIATDDVQNKIDTLSINTMYIKEAKETENIFHQHVMCDVCKMFPIVGIRYQCTVCKDFDLCEKCENLGTHEHVMLKIRKPKQAPSIVTTVNLFDNLNNQENGLHLPQRDNLRSQINEIYQSINYSANQNVITPMANSISIFFHDYQEVKEIEKTQLNRSNNLVVVELCELLGIRPEIAQTLIELFPTLNAKEIKEIVGDDLDYLISLKKSTS